MNPAYSDEFQFVTFTDSSSGGPCVKFRLPSRDLLDSFVGKEGKRFAAVLIEIADDETPVEGKGAPKPEKAPEQPEKAKGGPLSQWAALRCKEERFRAWLKERGDFAGEPLNEIEAAAIVREWCGVESRADLDTDRVAAEKFDKHIRKPFAAHLASIGATA